MVIGDGEKMPAALVQPNFEFIVEWAKMHNITLGDSTEEQITNPKLVERIQKEIEQHNAKFGKWEQVKRFELTPDTWSIEAGHLTPTMKMKRKIIKEKYISLYNKIYEKN
jgi:long-chain acyl-CoA synthetase